MSAVVVKFPHRRLAELRAAPCHVCGENSQSVLVSMDNSLWALKCNHCGFVVMVGEEADSQDHSPGGGEAA